MQNGGLTWLRAGCYLVLVVTLTVLTGSVRAATLSGKILDEQRKPLIGATVLVVELKKGTQTDDKGVFRIEGLPSGTCTVQIQYIGYKAFTRSVTLSEKETRLEAQMEAEPLVGETVTVTGERSSAGELTGSSGSVSVLSPEKLEEMRGQSLGETLESLPGVTSLTTGPTVSKPVVRGLHSERVLVLNGGVVQEGQQWGGDHAPEIDPFSPARIEVLKGAAGVEYGIGAIGGVIRIEPNPLRIEPGLNGRFSVNTFSNNRQGAGSLTLEGGLRWIRGFGWRFQGSYRRAGDSRAPVHVIRNSGFAERDFSVALGLNRDRVGIEALYSHFGTELGIYKDSHIGNTTDLLRAIERGEPTTAGTFTYRIENPRQIVAHDVISVKSRLRLTRIGTLELHYAFQYNQREEWDAHQPFSSSAPTKPAFNLHLASQSGEMVLRLLPMGDWQTRIGVNLTQQDNTRFSVGFLIPDFSTYSTGVFALETWNRDRWKVEAGGRLDYRWLKIFPNANRHIVERVHTYTNVTGALGIVYQIGKAWAVGMDIGQAWRPPGVNELYSDGVHHGTAQYEKGDASLAVEKSLNTALTLRYHGERGQGEIGVFRTAFRNFINLLPNNEIILTIRGAFPVYRHVQSDAVIQGFDGHIDYDLTGFLTASVSVSVVRGFERGNGQPLFHMPSDRLILDMDGHLPQWGRFVKHSVGLSTKLVRRQNRYPAGVDFTAPPRGYGAINAHYLSQLAFGKNLIHLQFGVDNLLDKRYRDYLSRYRYFIDDPGRNFNFRLSIPFGQAEQ